MTIHTLGFRPIDVWPDGWKIPRERRSCPFRASYADTLDLLDHEADALGARGRVLVQVDARPEDIRLDGQLRAGARVSHPGVIVTLDTTRHGVLVYPCDAFSGWSRYPGWQANLRAVALGLEALRKVERYGIAERGQQYAGFGVLPQATPMGGSLTVEDAARYIARNSWPGENEDCQERWFRRIIDEPEMLASEYRRAAKRLHPDAGGDPAEFRRLNEARDLILAHMPDTPGVSALR